MKTITFYSYKGGVGRSLALSNIAIRLSELNKKVCLLDFDLEAPGLQFKFKNYTPSGEIKLGLTDYIHKFSCEGIIANRIKNFSIKLKANNKIFEPISFIPAGNIDSSEYWKKLSMIKWSEMFYSEQAQGVKFFLDLKNKIEKEIKPDFLLIDSRTGITDIAGITLKLLADEVVVLGAYSQENIHGSKKILKSLLDESNALLDKIPKLNFVLTRLPFTGKLEDLEKEFILLSNLKKEFQTYLGVTEFEISVIHSDRRLELDEKPLIGDEYEEKGVSISNDYLKLFDRLTIGSFSESEINKFKNIRTAEKEYNKSKLETKTIQKIEHLNKAILNNPMKYEYYLDRAKQFDKILEYDNSINDYTHLLKLNPDSWEARYALAWIYHTIKKDYSKALENLNLAIDINILNSASYQLKYFILIKLKKIEEAAAILNYALDKINPNDSRLLNSRADLYRQMGEFKNAYLDVYKAIELDSYEPVYFGTLAEIYASEGKMEEFYLNLTIALSKGITTKALNTANDVYLKFKNEERFILLMEKYNIDIEEIFSENLD